MPRGVYPRLPAHKRLGEKNPRAKLPNSQVKMLREYRAAGWTHKELAFFFEISEGCVSLICRGLSYRDAGGPIEARYTYRTHRGRPSSSR